MSHKKKQRLWIRTGILLVLALAIAYTLYANYSSEQKKMISTGDMAPNFTLTSVDGSQISLEDYKGKGVFLNFWGTWCKPCKEEMPYMQELSEVYRDKGVEILAVNVGEPLFQVENFISQYGLTFDVVLDGNRDVVKQYGVIPLPTTFLISPEGEVVDVIESTMTKEEIDRHLQSIMP
ncbi:thiol-disulfide oxidoreductase ResA [Mangrovibacillus cuniculi]|uniref:Thiol-disulfide oxidoreductase ResA n=1 Tax=Mangrovibacillus cuniculi TaxID=2593652 RepID=A0A7S8CBG7_9BACI|nr:thiol-disulfide oxidoreductase ResA [Mangrovibacillus cuniculi]QPC46738.1 thiol-disulfide oxidoreductase ResA [Mangrovibacillus cuniculi]